MARREWKAGLKGAKVARCLRNWDCLVDCLDEHLGLAFASAPLCRLASSFAVLHRYSFAKAVVFLPGLSPPSIDDRYLVDFQDVVVVVVIVIVIVAIVIDVLVFYSWLYEIKLLRSWG